MSCPKLVLKRGREFAVRMGHPWIFSGAFERIPKDLQDGELVEIIASDKSFVGRGHFARDRSIAVKVLTTQPEDIDAAFWLRRFQDARRYRELIGLPASDTDSYRLIYGEGDRLPGLIVDIYGDAVVLQIHSPGMLRSRAAIIQGLEQVLQGKFKTIYEKSSETIEGGANEHHRGKDVVGVATERGLQFRVNWSSGQKTGFFLDQRLNRQVIEELSSGLSVLNTFCYSGGFSLAALRGGARRVVSLDSSQQAISLLDENIALNGCRRDHLSVCEDAFRYLENLREQFDLVIVDPPAFAKRRNDIENALKGYERLNALALKAVAPGGLLASFSCSQLIERSAFQRALAQSLARAGRTGRIVQRFEQAPCHPTLPAFPEGDYLKGFLIRCDAQ